MSRSEQITILAKERDAFLLLAEAKNDRIELLNPDRTEREYNTESLKYVKTEGPSGVYQRYPVQGEKIESTPDYRGLLADLNEHDGKLTRNGLFYWLFSDGATIGKKPSKKK